jgi:hypothetical protein
MTADDISRKRLRGSLNLVPSRKERNKGLAVKVPSKMNPLQYVRICHLNDRDVRSYVMTHGTAVSALCKFPTLQFLQLLEKGSPRPSRFSNY